MNEAGVRELVAAIQSGDVSADEAVHQLARLPFADVGDALVDHHRELRQGASEAVYGPGKSPQQCVTIVGELLESGTGPVLCTRTSPAQRDALTGAFAERAEFGGTAMLWRRPEARGDVRVLVVTAGTADVPVADEAVLTLAANGLPAMRITDVGVAGIHRLLARIDDITSADATIVCAGMEGALASVVGGLTSTPVIAVPTSVGYGSSLDGVTALLAMTASCASGVSVVGIDNGFGAAMAIHRIMRQPSRASTLDAST